MVSGGGGGLPRHLPYHEPLLRLQSNSPAVPSLFTIPNFFGFWKVIRACVFYGLGN